METRLGIKPFRVFGIEVLPQKEHVMWPQFTHTLIGYNSCDSTKGMATITKVMLSATSFIISWSLFLPANSSRYTYLVTTIKDNTTLYK